MKALARTASCATFALGLAISGATLGQTTGKDNDTATPKTKNEGNPSPAVKIGNPDPTRAMDGLLEAVRNLRQAVVLMLDKEKSAEREKAVEAAVQGIADAQRAMMLLPRAYRVSSEDLHKATDWPVAAGRLDTAAQELESAVNALQASGEGEDRSKAVKAVQDSLAKAHEAIAALPDWTVENQGKN